MPKKPRNRTLDYTVYLAVRIAMFAIQAAPLRVALGSARVLGFLAYLVDKRHREVARDNLKHAFPERCADPRECNRLIRACYYHFATVTIEIACLPRRVHTYAWRRSIDVHNIHLLVDHVLGDRPVLLVTGHFGNWEAAGYATGLTGLKTYAIARVLDNPYLHRFMLRFREKTGQTILNKSGDFDRIAAVMENRGVIATLGDQDAGEKGLFVNFFNRPASTHKAVALLSLQYDAPMIVVGVPRVGTPMRFKCIIEEVIDPRDYSKQQSKSVEAMTIRFTQAIERMARQYPEQYFWLHRRWKHKPPAPRQKLVKGQTPGQTESRPQQLAT